MQLCVTSPLSVVSICLFVSSILPIAGTKHCVDQLSHKPSYESLFHGDHSTWPESEHYGLLGDQTSSDSQCSVAVTRIRGQQVSSAPNSYHGNHSKNRKNANHRKLKGTKKQRKKEKRKKLKKKHNKPKKRKLKT